MKRNGWLVLTLLAVVAALAWWWWRKRQVQATTSVGPLTVVSTNPPAPTFQGSEKTGYVEKAGNVTPAPSEAVQVTGNLGVGIPITYYDGVLLL